MFLFPCPCGKKVRVHAADAGGTVPCACGQAVAVPSLGELRREAELEGQLPPPTPPLRHDWRMWWWGVGLAVTGYGLQVIGAVLVTNTYAGAGLLIVGYILAVVGGLVIGLGKGFALWFCLLLAFCIPFGGLVLLFFPGKGLDREP